MMIPINKKTVGFALSMAFQVSMIVANSTIVKDRIQQIQGKKKPADDVTEAFEDKPKKK